MQFNRRRVNNEILTPSSDFSFNTPPQIITTPTVSATGVFGKSIRSVVDSEWSGLDSDVKGSMTLKVRLISSVNWDSKLFLSNDRC